MMKSIGTKAIKIGVMMVTAVLMLTGCRFGFASDPDDPNEVVRLNMTRLCRVLKSGF